MYGSSDGAPHEVMDDVVLAVHGGAVQKSSDAMDAFQVEQYHECLKAALLKGFEALSAGLPLDAVEAAIHVLEDSPLFNAGYGAAFTHDGKIELDASVMVGDTLQAGAVAGVTSVKNPISAARLVMEHSEHVLMTGRGAERFAREGGLVIVDPDYFWTDHQWQNLQKLLKQKREQEIGLPEKYGTVGAVACNSAGQVAAGTSTGGIPDQKFGRVGDSPIIGAGTYADNRSCAISCTGHGEYFIRLAVAHEIGALMRHKNDNIDAACYQVVHKDLKQMGGSGGVIALSPAGRCVFSFNSCSMFRGCITSSGRVYTAIDPLP